MALRRARRYRGWSQDQAAAELHQLAGKLGEPEPGVDGNTVSRWERGTLTVSPRYTRLLTLLYEREPHELGLEDPAPTDITEASELLAVIEGTDTSGGVVADTEAAVLRLRRASSHTPPPILSSQIDIRLRAIRQFLRGRLTLSQRRDLLAASGWLALLQGTVWFDRAQRDAAWLYRDVALRIAQELGHAELEAWSWETPAWFMLLDNRYRDSSELSQAGQPTAPATSSVRTALFMQEARARARLDERTETIAAIRHAQEAMDKLTPPKYLDDHYVFDPAKIDFYAATCYLWLNEPRRAEQHARQVIAASSDPNGGNYWPTRVGSARMDLGLALAQRGQVDTAAYEATLAFDSPFIRRSTLLRARELLKVLTPYVAVPEVRDF